MQKSSKDRSEEIHLFYHRIGLIPEKIIYEEMSLEAVVNLILSDVQIEINTLG